MKIERYFDKKENTQKFRARFQLNNKEFYPVADSRKKLLEIIDEIRAMQHRTKYELPVAKASRELKELFSIHLPRIEKKHQRILASRVFDLLLALLPENIKIGELKKAHFQKYIDLRRKQFGVQTKKPILPETIDKELYAVSSALTAAPLYFAELEDYQKPLIPKAAKGKKRRRSRLVNKSDELDILLCELRLPHTGKQTVKTEKHRTRLADDLEFRFETGLRRIESARLKISQFYEKDNCLREVRRWKTNTITPYFPLSVRAREIIDQRIKASGSEYIFTSDGEAVESDYRTLKTTCQKLNIKYGRYVDGGFTPHDLRHNFATEISRVTDIETAKSLTGHTGNEIFTYLHTDEKRQREAVAKRENKDAAKDLIGIYKDIKRGKIKLKMFLEKVKKIGGF